MSRQQFIAELTQYLTFVTAAESEEIIRVFEERFDRVGAEGEATLLMELGTPMSIAIALKRRKESGNLDLSGASKHADPDGDVSETKEPDAPASPVLQMPERADSFESMDGMLSKTNDEAEQLPLNEFSGIPTGKPTATFSHIHSEPQKALSPGEAFGAVLLSILIVAVFALPIFIGGYLVIIMANFLFGALQTMSAITDALWMFSLGFILGSIGLFILWFFLWAAISIIRRMFCGKPPKDSSFRRGVRKTWKNIAITGVFILVLGIACGVLGNYMGGSPNDLFTNKTALILLDWLVENSVAQYVTAIFG